MTDLLSQETRDEIDQWLKKYPKDQKQSVVMTALRLVQDQNDGWLTEELMDAVATYLDMPKIAVYEVATFYSMYDLEPVGKHKIFVCTNVSCMLRGSEKITDHLKEKLKINFGETSVDGNYTLKEVECLGACVGAPMMQIGNQYYEHLTPEKVNDILEAIEK